MLRLSVQYIAKNIKKFPYSSIQRDLLNHNISLTSQEISKTLFPTTQIVICNNFFIRRIQTKSTLSLYAPVETLVDLLQKGETKDVLDIVNNTLIPYRSTEHAKLIKNSKDSKTIHELFQSAKKHNIYLDYTMCASALDAYLSLKDYISAESLFNEYHAMYSSNYNSYLCNIMLKIYSETNMYQKAIDLVHRICQSGQCPSTTSFTLLLFLLLRNQCWDKVDNLLKTMKQLSIVLPSSLSTQIFDYYYKSNQKIPSLFYSIIHMDNHGNTIDSYIQLLQTNISKKKHNDVLSIYNEIQAKNIHITDDFLLYSLEESLFNIYKGMPLPASYLNENNELLTNLYMIHSSCLNHKWNDTFEHYILNINNQKSQTLYLSFYLSQLFTIFNNSNEEYNHILNQLNSILSSYPMSITNYEYIFSKCSKSVNPHTRDVLSLYSTMKNSSIPPTINIFDSLFQICAHHTIPMDTMDQFYRDLFQYHIPRDKKLYLKLLPLFMEPTMSRFQSILKDMKKDDIHIDDDIYHMIFTGFIQNQKYIEGIQYYIQNNRDIETSLQIKLDIMKCSLYSKDKKMLLATLSNICQSPYDRDYELVYGQLKEVFDVLNKKENFDTLQSIYNTILDSYMNKRSLLSFPKYLLKKFSPNSLNNTLKQLLWNSYIDKQINVKLNNHLMDTPLFVNLLHICPNPEKSMNIILREIKKNYTSNPPTSFLPFLFSWYIENNDISNLILFSTQYMKTFQQVYEPAILHILSSSLYSKSNRTMINPTKDTSSVDSFIQCLLSQSTPSVLTNTVLSYIGSYYAYTSKNDLLNTFISKYPKVNINMYLFKNYINSLSHKKGTNNNINKQNKRNIKQK